MSADMITLILTTFRSASALGDAGDALVADLGLTRARWQVLGAMATLGAPATVSQIARAMGLTRQAVQRTADDLARAGMAEYRDNPAHARAGLLAMTEQGKTAHDEAMRRQMKWADQLAQGLSADELKTTRRVLQHIGRMAVSPRL